MEDELEGHETIILALEMVEDPTNLRFGALKDLAFENIQPRASITQSEPKFNRPSFATKNLENLSRSKLKQSSSRKISFSKKPQDSSLDEIRQSIRNYRNSTGKKPRKMSNDSDLIEKLSRSSGGTREKFLHILGRNSFKRTNKSDSNSNSGQSSFARNTLTTNKTSRKMSENLNDPTLKRMDSPKQNLLEQDLEQEIDFEEDENLGDHLLDAKIYLDSLDKYMGNVKKGESLIFLFPDSKLQSKLSYYFKVFVDTLTDDQITKRKNYFLIGELIFIICVVLSPAFVQNFGNDHLHNFFISGVCSTALFLKVRLQI